MIHSPLNYHGICFTQRIKCLLQMNEIILTNYLIRKTLSAKSQINKLKINILFDQENKLYL